MQTGKIKRQLPAGKGDRTNFLNIDLLGPRVEVKAMTYIDPYQKPMGNNEGFRFNPKDMGCSM